MKTSFLRGWVGLIGLLGIGLLPDTSRADFLFFVGNPTGFQSTLGSMGTSVNNVLFNTPGLITTGTTVQGQIQTGGLLDISSDVTLITPAIGQARVEAVDGSFTLLMLTLEDPLGVIRALSFNTNTPSSAAGVLTLTIQEPTGTTHQASLDISTGLNFFGVIATNNDNFVKATLTGSAPIQDVRQIRISDPGAEAPEPASLVLFGLGLTLLGFSRSLRRWAQVPDLAEGAQQHPADLPAPQQISP